MANKELRRRVVALEKALTEVKTWAKYDEIAHERYIDDLADDIDAYEMDQLYLRSGEGELEQLPKDQWLDKIVALSARGNEAIDLTEPLSLFGHQIRLGLTERLNVMERETVGCYRAKLELKNEEILDLKKRLYGEDYQEGDSAATGRKTEDSGPEEDEIFVNPLEAMIQ